MTQPYAYPEPQTDETAEDWERSLVAIGINPYGEAMTEQSKVAGLTERLARRILAKHGGLADPWPHHWNLTEGDSLLHREALDALAATPTDQKVEAALEVKQLRIAAGQASFCLRQLLPDEPDAQMTVRMLEDALAATKERHE